MTIKFIKDDNGQIKEYNQRQYHFSAEFFNQIEESGTVKIHKDQWRYLVDLVLQQRKYKNSIDLANYLFEKNDRGNSFSEKFNLANSLFKKDVKDISGQGGYQSVVNAHYYELLRRLRNNSIFFNENSFIGVGAIRSQNKFNNKKQVDNNLVLLNKQICCKFSDSKIYNDQQIDQDRLFEVPKRSFLKLFSLCSLASYKKIISDRDRFHHQSCCLSLEKRCFHIGEEYCLSYEPLVYCIMQAIAICDALQKKYIGLIPTEEYNFKFNLKFQSHSFICPRIFKDEKEILPLLFDSHFPHKIPTFEFIFYLKKNTQLWGNIAYLYEFYNDPEYKNDKDLFEKLRYGSKIDRSIITEWEWHLNQINFRL